MQLDQVEKSEVIQRVEEDALSQLLNALTSNLMQEVEILRKYPAPIQRQIVSDTPYILVL